jgi:hypothetical protein
VKNANAAVGLAAILGGFLWWLGGREEEITESEALEPITAIRMSERGWKVSSGPDQVVVDENGVVWAMDPKRVRAHPGAIVFVLPAASRRPSSGRPGEAERATGKLVRQLLDRYQSIGFVEVDSPAGAVVAGLPFAGPGAPTRSARSVAVIAVSDPALFLGLGERPSRAFERGLVAAADAGSLTVSWRDATPGDLSELHLVGQF